MKILIVFLDMIRTDHMNIYNPKCEDTPLDTYFKEIGGTLYNRCYTPGPDTPRSNACMQTGYFPNNNGCDIRLKWPRDYIKPGIATFFDKAIEKGYVINICSSDVLKHIGLLKIREEEKINWFNNPHDFVEKSKITDDTICYIADQDMHFSIDDFNSTEYGIKNGFAKIVKLLNLYINNSFIDKFDHVFFYSDHGVRLLSEKYSQKHILDLLNDGRTRILMFHHNNGDNYVKVSQKLSCIVDLYSTICNLIGDQELRQGENMISDKSNDERIVFVEDHDNFSVGANIGIAQWRVISDTFDLRTNIFETIIDKGSEKDIDKAIGYLKKVSPSVEKMIKYVEFRKKYADLKESDCYLVGDKRLDIPKRLFIRILLKIQSFYYSVSCKLK